MISEKADRCAWSDGGARHELSKGSLVLSEQIVDDGTPVSDALSVHLKKARFEKKFERFFAPRFSRVLVTAEGSQQ